MKKKIPEGDYIFWIVRAEPSRRMIQVTFQSREISLTESFPTSGPGVWRLKEMLEACGKKILRQRGKLHLDKLIGLECAGSVVNDEELGTVIGAFFSPQNLKENFATVIREMSGGEMPRYVM